MATPTLTGQVTEGTPVIRRWHRRCPVAGNVSYPVVLSRWLS